MSQPARVPLWDPPPAPTDLTATVKEGGVELAWTSPDGLRHPLLRNVAPTPVPVGRPGTAPAAGTSPTRPGGAPPVVGGVPPTAGSAASAAPATAPLPVQPADEEDADVDAAADARRDAAMSAAAQARAMAAQASGEPTSSQNPPAAAGTAPAEAAAGALPDDSIVDTTLPSRALFPWPASGAGFVVYEVQPPDAKADGIPPPPAVQPFPKPLTPLAVRATTYSDPRVEYGVTRCYVVRTSEAVGTLAVESAASAPACVSPKDLFAPAAPKSLGAVSSEGTISLIWEAGTEADLAGYIVLRGENGGPLRPITPAPIKETTFRDTRVRRGTRYTYAVVALDAANPPNRSGESNHVEETAR